MPDNLVSIVNSIITNFDITNITDEQIVAYLGENTVSVLSFLGYLLDEFIYYNFLGGDLAEEPDWESLNQIARSNLICDGEAPFKKTKLLGFLWIAKRIAVHMRELSKTLLFHYLLVSLKCIYLHQAVIGHERSVSLDEELQDVLNLIQPDLDHMEDLPKLDLICFFILTSSLSCFYYRYEAAENFASQCTDLLQVSIDFSGALGKRTRFQESNVSNLCIRVKRRQASLVELKYCSEPLPKMVKLDDDVLLNTVKFIDDSENQFPVLSVEEQSLLLLLCDLMRLSCPRDELSIEQRMTYINTILRQAYPDCKETDDTHVSCWPVATEALFWRSVLEHTSVRKTQRAISQLEELANQFNRSTPAASQRGSNLFFLTRMPSIWTIEIEQAHLLVKLGCYKSALDVYLKWDQWFDIIECYTHLNKREMAEEVIRAQLTVDDKSPELYCALGDVTNDRQHYLTAWEVSGHKSARAMRSLAVVYMYKDKDYERAAECFEKSLAINNLQVSLWFTYGCCCLQMKSYAKAEKAFHRCVQINPDNFEAWNNCASAVVLRGKKDIALKLLKEACKYNYENWRIWENISIISADVGSFTDTIQACHRLIDLRGKFSDADVLDVLTRAVVKEVIDQSDNNASMLRPKLLELFGRITASTPSVANIWSLYADLLLNERPLQPATFQRAIQHLQAAHRCRIQTSEGKWEHVSDKRRAVITGLHRLADLLFEADSLVTCSNPAENGGDVVCIGHQAFIISNLSTLRLSVNSIKARLKLAKEATIQTETTNEIQKLYDDLQDLLQQIESKLD